MIKLLKFTLVFLLYLTISDGVQAQRFPKPEFQNGHQQPPTITPSPRTAWLDWLDVIVLVGSLTVVSWLVIKKRSRRGVFWMSLFSIAYFGFFRQGCICSVGSLQNITLALFNPDYVIPVTAILFFIIPILFTLFFGRTFCAAVCPLGAIQDVIAFRPMPIKEWLQKLLGLIPYIYLGLAVLYAATATDFVICRYDPFVGIYRLDATFTMLVIGGLILATGVFIARPYCRFLCPYGVILKWVSKFSKHHITITPASCIQCRLCENSCPFGAIDKPVESVKIDRRVQVKRFIGLSIIIPLLVIVGGWTGARFHENLAMVDSKVRLAHELMTLPPGNKLPESIDIEGFRTSGKSIAQFYTEVAAKVALFKKGGWWLGAFIGLVFGLTLAGLSIFRYRTDYMPNKGDCLSCARCIDYCPVPPEKSD